MSPTWPVTADLCVTLSFFCILPGRMGSSFSSGGYNTSAFKSDIFQDDLACLEEAWYLEGKTFLLVYLPWSSAVLGLLQWTELEKLCTWININTIWCIHLISPPYVTSLSSALWPYSPCASSLLPYSTCSCSCSSRGRLHCPSEGHTWFRQLPLSAGFCSSKLPFLPISFLW